MSSKPKKVASDTAGTSKQKSTTTGTTSSSSSSSSSSSASRTPWEAAEGYIRDLYSTGAGALADTQGKLFGGDFIAGPTQAQRDSVQSLLAAAPGLSAGAQPLQDFATRVASGEFLDPNNPVLQAGISAVNNPILRNLQEKILPGITDAAVRGGAYGGTANALLNTNAISDFDTTSLENAGKMTLDWLNSRMGDIFNSGNLFKTANELALAPGTVQGLAGEAERGLNQLGIDNSLKQYENEMTAPWYGIDQFINLLTQGGFGNATSSGTQTSTSKGTNTGKTTSQGSTTGNTITTGAQPDMATQILQGLSGGVSGLSGLGKAFPQTMEAIGSGSIMAPIISGLSFLSDRRLKRDIVRIGRADNGLPIYRYRYIGSGMYQIGFMADEVEAKIPEAVFSSPEGIKYVDYARATEIQ